MQKREQSSRQIVMCHLMAIRGININKASQLVVDMEEVGLIQFNPSGEINFPS